MGWFTSAVSAINKSVAGKVLDTVSAVYSHPFKTVGAIISPTKTVQDVVKEHFAQPVSKQITDTALAAFGYVTATKTIAAAAIKGVSAAISSLIPATTKGKIIAGFAVPIVAGAFISDPAAVANIPSKLAKAGADIVKVTSEPTLANALSFLAEHPYLTAATALAALTAAGFGASLAARAIASYYGSKTTVVVETPDNAVNGTPTLPVEKTLPTDEAGAVLPQTQTITTGKRRRRAGKAKISAVNQNVRIMIQNSSRSTGMRITRERYLNTRLLA